VKAHGQYLLDTNTARSAMRGSPRSVRRRIASLRPGNIFLSTITEGEMLYGLGKNPAAVRLDRNVREFLARFNILPWDSEAAAAYGRLRAAAEAEGLTIGGMDMLIAAHASTIDAVLVTGEKAMHRLKTWIKVEDWAK
jgi:tRNA(fMet)-specific endonuclease VapC